jgi:hypothetical protein
MKICKFRSKFSIINVTRTFNKYVIKGTCQQDVFLLFYYEWAPPAPMT